MPHVLPALQRELFAAVLEELASAHELVNEVIEIALEEDAAIMTWYAFPEPGMTKFLADINGVNSIDSVARISGRHTNDQVLASSDS